MFCGYLGYSAFSDKKTEENYTNAANEFEKAVTGSGKKANMGNSTLNAINATVTNNNKRYMEDYEILGTIEIPKVNLKCAILNEVTPRAIQIAVGQIYTANGLNKPGNTVIYGHNYRNNLFFSRNDELNNGDKIYILDQEGIKITYEIYNIFITTSTDTSFYTRNSEDTGGKAEITLATCTDDAETTDRRLIVQAREID